MSRDTETSAPWSFKDRVRTARIFHQPFGLIARGWRTRKPEAAVSAPSYEPDDLADPRDPFAPPLSPIGQLWQALDLALPSAIKAGFTDAFGEAPSYGEARPEGRLIGHLAILRASHHRMLVRINPDPSARDEPRSDLGEIAEIGVAFDDRFAEIPALTFQVTVDEHGQPGERVSIAAWDGAPLPVWTKTCTVDSAFEMSVEPLLEVVLHEARAHRWAHLSDARRTIESAIPRPEVERHEWSFGGVPVQALTLPEIISIDPDILVPDAQPSRDERPSEDVDQQRMEHLLREERERRAKRAAKIAPAEPTPQTPQTPIDLYQIDELKALVATRPPGDETERGGGHYKVLSKLLSRGQRGAQRWLSHGDAAMLEALAEVDARAPHFAAVTAMVHAHVLASIHTGTPLRLPPTLIVDEPGTGKTWYLTRIARALGVPFKAVSMAAVTTGDTIQGNNPSWRNSQQGIVSKLLIGERIANPVVFVDEFDKGVGENNVAGSPYRPYYAALEPENARNFVDEFLDLGIDAAHILWMLAANSLEPIPEPIRSRLTVIQMTPMTQAHRRAVAQSVYRDANARLGDWFEPEIDGAALTILETRTPREMRKALDQALIQAGSENRRGLTPGDIEIALTRVTAQEPVRSFGFTGGR